MNENLTLARQIQEVLYFRIKSLRASGYGEITYLLERDLKEIMELIQRSNL